MPINNHFPMENAQLRKSKHDPPLFSKKRSSSFNWSSIPLHLPLGSVCCRSSRKAVVPISVPGLLWKLKRFSHRCKCGSIRWPKMQKYFPLTKYTRMQCFLFAPVHFWELTRRVIVSAKDHPSPMLFCVVPPVLLPLINEGLSRLFATLMD